jgi:hypothetical protein
VSLPWLYAGSVSPPLASQTSSARSACCAVRQGGPHRPKGDSDRARARPGCPCRTEARLEQADPSPPERRRRTGRLAGSRCPRQPRLRQAEGNDRQRAASRESNVSRFLDQLSLEELEALARHGRLEALSEEEVAEQLGRFSPRTGAAGFAGSTLKQRLRRTTRRRQWLSLKVCARPSTSQGRAPIEQPISPRLTADE